MNRGKRRWAYRIPGETHGPCRADYAGKLPVTLLDGKAGRSRNYSGGAPDKPDTQSGTRREASRHCQQRDSKGMRDRRATVIAVQHAVKNAANDGDAQRRADLQR